MKTWADSIREMCEQYLNQCEEVNMGYPAFSSPAPAQARVVLELNGDEAQTLADILSAVSGTQDTRRAYVDSILNALESVDYVDSGGGDLWGEIGFE